MTFLQLKVALGVNETGSISKAAKKLSISQPNASSCIKALESEVGFVIFNRNKDGALLTEKGRMFIARATKMVADYEAITDIKKHADIYRLRVGASNYYDAIEPFIKICAAHTSDPEAELKCLSVSVDEGVRGLENYELDVVFSPVLKSQLAGTERLCREKNLSIISLGELPAVINLREGHPAIRDGRCIGLKQGSDAMKDFPYVAYRNLSEVSGSTGYYDSDFVKCSYKIYVDDVNTRVRLVADSDAFSFGLKPSKGLRERYGFVSFPVPGVSMDLLCLTRAEDTDRKEINEYLTLLRDELGMDR